MKPGARNGAPSTGRRPRALWTMGDDVLGDRFPVARFACESRVLGWTSPRKTWNQQKVWCISVSGDPGPTPVVSLS